MNRIASLAVEVGADITPLTKGFRKANGEVGRFSARTVQATKLIANSFKVAAAASVGMAAGMVGVAKAALTTAENLSDMANKANVGVERLQELRFAADQNGASARDMDDALTRLTRRMSLFATDGGGPAKLAIQELDIAVTDASGNLRTSGDVFDEIVAKFGLLENNAKKAALASALFGEDAGPRLVPLLNQGVAGMAALTAEADRLGLVLDGVAVRDAAEANAQFRRLADSIKTQLQAAVLENIDSWSTLASGLTDVVVPAMNAVVRAIAGIVEQVRAAANAVGGFFQTVATGQGATTGRNRGRSPNTSDEATTVGEIGQWAGDFLGLGTTPGTVRRNSDIGGVAGPVQGPAWPGPEQGPQVGDAGMTFGSILGLPENADDLLAEARAKVQDHQDRLTEIASRGANARSEVVEDEFKSVGDVTKSGLANLSSLSRTGNKELFEIGKAASIAQGLLSAREAITTAYAAGSKIGGPPLGAAYAATAGAAQFANLAAIKATSFGGGGGGGASSFGGSSYSSTTTSTSATDTGVQSPQEIKVSGLSAAEIYSGDVVLSLLDKLSEAAGDRGMTLMVQS